MSDTYDTSPPIVETQIVYVYKKYPSAKRANQRYYNKIKNNDDYKEKQRLSSKHYYERNKEKVLQKLAQERADKKKLRQAYVDEAKIGNTDLTTIIDDI